MREGKWKRGTSRSAVTDRRVIDGRRAQWSGVRCLLAAVAALSWTACSEPAGPGLGDVRVAITTTGGDWDENGYVIVIDDERREQTTANDSRVIRDLGSGTHSIALEDVADNCTVSGTHLRSVAISTEVRAEVEFLVSCDATGIAITTVTSGLDAPPPYEVQVDGLAPQLIAPSGTLLVSRLEPGTHAVELSDVAEACTVEGASRVTVEVTFRAVTAVAFNVTCSVLTGVVRVTVATAGTDPDPNGYTLLIGGRQSPVPVNGVVTLQPLYGGTYVQQLSGVASNCSVAAGAVRTVTVTAGGTTRDTIDTRFDVSCVRTEKIAYVQQENIVVAYADGSNPVSFGFGHGPSWSPDGTQLVYSTLACEYYGYYCGGGLKVLDLETGDVTVLPNGDGGTDPAWSADGQRIAFVYVAPDDSRNLAVITVGDNLPPVFPLASGATPLASWPSSPSWSPDGARIVFDCVITGSNASDICAVNRNGTDFQRLTQAEGRAYDPAWSPDGSRIVFATRGLGNNQTTELALMAPDGSGVTRLDAGWSPAWVPDGSRILFARADGIFVINPNGSGLTRLTTGPHYGPAWRP